MSTVIFIPGFLMATLAGLVFFFFTNDRFSRVFLYIFTANVFFFLGQFVSDRMDWKLMRLGSYNLFPDLLSAFTGLTLIRYFSQPAQKKPRGNQSP